MIHDQNIHEVNEKLSSEYILCGMNKLFVDV